MTLALLYKPLNQDHQCVLPSATLTLSPKIPTLEDSSAVVVIEQPIIRMTTGDAPIVYKKRKLRPVPLVVELPSASLIIQAKPISSAITEETRCVLPVAKIPIHALPPSAKLEYNLFDWEIETIALTLTM